MPVKYVISDPHHVDTSMNFETIDRDEAIKHVQEKYAGNRMKFGECAIRVVESLGAFDFISAIKGTITEVRIGVQII